MDFCQAVSWYFQWWFKFHLPCVCRYFKENRGFTPELAHLRGPAGVSKCVAKITGYVQAGHYRAGQW